MGELIRVNFNAPPPSMYDSPMNIEYEPELFCLPRDQLVLLAIDRENDYRQAVRNYRLHKAASDELKTAMYGVIRTTCLLSEHDQRQIESRAIQ